MLLTLASIFLFFLLNLLLGSVHIPLRSVWNILWGNTDESVIWQNYYLEVPRAPSVDGIGGGSRAVSQRSADADGVPQSAGRASVLGISSGASLGVACVVLLSGAWAVWHWSRLGVYGRGCLVGCRPLSVRWL